MTAPVGNVADFPFGPEVHAPPVGPAGVERLRVIVRVQLRCVHRQESVPCGACGRPLAVQFVFRCFHCGVYVCGACGPAHFGPRVEPTP